jgi:thioredoxin-like negative regulator of GroEL
MIGHRFRTVGHRPGSILGAMTTQDSDATFAAEVERSPVPVLLGLWAAWCRPCPLMGPVLGELAVELAGRVRVAKLNVDDTRRLERLLATARTA